MYVCITNQNKALILHDPMLLFCLRPAVQLNSLICSMLLVMVWCLFFFFFMKLSRTFYHTNNSFLAYVSFLGEKLSITHEPWEKWGEGGGGEFSSCMNFFLTKYIYFLFRPPTPPTHNFSKCPSLMTQTVNNDRLHWGRTNSNSLGMWRLLSSLIHKTKALYRCRNC